MTVKIKNYLIVGYSLLLASFWAVAILVALLSYLPRSAVSFPYVSKLVVKTFLPEGWNFFTRNPREELVYLYKKDQRNNWQTYSKSINGDISNMFGLRKDARAIGSEYALLFSAHKMTWKECPSGSSNCYLTDTTSVQVINSLETPLLCGQFLFVLKQQTPWAWSPNEVHLPYKYLIINSKCQ